MLFLEIVETKAKLRRIVRNIGDNIAEICEIVLQNDETDIIREVKKRKKDPNAPKQPPSSFFLFNMDIKEQVDKEFPEASFGERSKIYSARWQGLSEAQRQAYNDKAKVAREQYLKELDAYKEAHPELYKPRKRARKKQPAPEPEKAAEVKQESSSESSSSSSSESNEDDSDELDSDSDKANSDNDKVKSENEADSDKADSDSDSDSDSSSDSDSDSDSASVKNKAESDKAGSDKSGSDKESSSDDSSSSSSSDQDSSDSDSD